MPKVDVTSEAVMDNSPMEVYKALMDEISGVTSWWMPHMKYQLRGDVPIDHEGAVFDAIINPTSRMNAKFSAKVTKIVEGKLMEDDISGCFIGTGKWTFEPTEDGKTKVQFRINARTNGIIYSIFAPFGSYENNHRDIMEKGFKALNSYLSKRR
jgi:uncharacterized protein YndB with AHSA1/START domain